MLAHNSRLRNRTSIHSSKSIEPLYLCLEIGAVRVRLSGILEQSAYFRQSLDAFQADNSEFDVSIRVEWAHKLPAANGKKTFDSGATWCVYDNVDGFEFDFHSLPGAQPHKCLLINRDFSDGLLLMSAEYFADASFDPDALGYPLDELLIMHRLTQEKAIELHGSGIVRANGDANLFVGHSGAGKSTTTRLWTEIEDVEVLSDDRIIVRRDEDASTANDETDGSSKNVGILRLRDCSASRNNLSAQDDRAIGNSASPTGHCAQDDKPKHKMRMYGTPWHGEAMFASPNSAPLTRIFVLEHGHGNVITRLSPSQAVAELFARSFVPFHRHEYGDSARVFLEELVDSVPVYRYAFEPDQRAVDIIRHFHD